MTDGTYFLSEHLHICKAQNYWVVLDAQADKYFCIPDEEIIAISPWLYGASALASSSNKEITDEATQVLIHTLISKGIITTNANHGKSFTPSTFFPPTRSLIPFQSINSANLSIRVIAIFLFACIQTDWRLRRRSAISTLERIAHGRRENATQTDNLDERRLISLQQIFLSLRPLYPRPYLCLFDSLALLAFLSHFQLFPRVIFGVVGNPFQAHCWLQDGGLVINDALETLTRYTTILAL